MYTDYFNLKEEPFQVTPNPKFLFLSNIHKEAIQKLVDGIRRRKGFIELVGMAGTGKTLLCKELIQMLSPEMEIAYIFYPVLNEQALYYAILKQWGLEVSEEMPVPALLERISSFLRDRYEKGRNALIILDEAQNLSLPLLENLRLLSNLETESEKLLQILLAGQPEFHDLLKSGRIPQLDQRIRVRIFLKPLDKSTLPLYVFHRLNRAGAGSAVSFTDDAFDVIYKYSGGIPRMINAVCERSLEEAALRKVGVVDGKIVRRAAEGLEGSTEASGIKNPPSRGNRRIVVPIVLAVLAVAVAVGVTWLRRGSLPEPVTVVKGHAPAPAERSGAEIPPVPPSRSAPLARNPDTFPIRLLPLQVMKNFLEGVVVVPEGKRLHWGMLRLAKRDLLDFSTPFLLHLVRKDGTSGWACARGVGQGFQLWRGGSWRPLPETLLALWTGRCGVPFWMGATPGNGRALRKGMRGEAVSDLQRWLVNLGRLDQVTGVFDERTEQTVKVFQTQQGLTPDGVAGSQTLALLFQKGNGKRMEEERANHDK